MKLRSTFRNSALVLALAVSTLATAAHSQTAASQAAADTSTSPWTTEQLLTCSVHDAWILSGKDEAKFFDMVKVMIELSEQKRGIDLPDSVETGTRLGTTIKRLAKADTDQLLYAVVDKAVMQAAHSKPVPAGTRAKKTTTGASQ
jgi:hypothetical protein